MDLFDTLTFAEILVGTTFLGTPTLIVLNMNSTFTILRKTHDHMDFQVRMLIEFYLNYT
jgi:hypothetical protein